MCTWGKIFLQCHEYYMQTQELQRIQHEIRMQHQALHELQRIAQEQTNEIEQHEEHLVHLEIAARFWEEHTYEVINKRNFG